MKNACGGNHTEIRVKINNAHNTHTEARNNSIIFVTTSAIFALEFWWTKCEVFLCIFSGLLRAIKQQWWRLCWAPSSTANDIGRLLLGWYCVYFFAFFPTLWQYAPQKLKTVGNLRANKHVANLPIFVTDVDSFFLKTTSDFLIVLSSFLIQALVPFAVAFNRLVRFHWFACKFRQIPIVLEYSDNDRCRPLCWERRQIKKFTDLCIKSSCRHHQTRVNTATMLNRLEFMPNHDSARRHNHMRTPYLNRIFKQIFHGINCSDVFTFESMAKMSPSLNRCWKTHHHQSKSIVPARVKIWSNSSQEVNVVDVREWLQITHMTTKKYVAFVFNGMKRMCGVRGFLKESLLSTDSNAARLKIGIFLLLVESRTIWGK